MKKGAYLLLLFWVLMIPSYGCGGGKGSGSSFSPIQWVEISASSGHTVALKSDGTIWSWGINGDGQIGDGTTINKSVPTQEITEARDWVAVAAGQNHTVAVKSDGTLWSWGENTEGQLGDGTNENRLVPTQEITKAEFWETVAAGGDHTIALEENGSLWSWGKNEFGQLGEGTTDDRNFPGPDSTLDSDWIAISAGSRHTVALKSDGSFWSWGYNGHGQLGAEEGSNTSRSIPGQEDTPEYNWTFISAGFNHTVALKSNGTLWAWGANDNSQLGDGTSTYREIPVQESTLAENWTSISASSSHTIAIKSNGTLWAWGNNSTGKLGDGTLTLRTTPTQEVTGSTLWSKTTAASGHTIALRSDGSLWSWGSNCGGLLGRGTDGNHSFPAQETTGATDWSFLSAGAGYTMALKADGTLWGWGNNQKEQLGDGTTINRQTPVQESTQATDWLSVSAGYFHTLALKTDGTLWGWGENSAGQLGDGSNIEKSVPTQESSKATNWVSIAAGGDHTLALQSNGSLWSWGDNSSGQLGDGSNSSRNSPGLVSSQANEWSSISVTGSSSIALKTDNTLWGWGNNWYGQLGTGTNSNSNIPIKESTEEPADWVMASSSNHTLARKSDNTLWSWGSNSWGQMGDGTETDSLIPVQESTQATNWTDLSSGGQHSVALKSDGTLWSWGAGHSGQLGTGTALSSTTPLQEMTQATDWISISSGGAHTVALKQEGTLWVWGNNFYGRLGTGDSWYSVPGEIP